MHVLLQLALALACQPSSIVLPSSCDYCSQGASSKIALRDIVVFGDSFTDNGNVYRFTNESWPADPAYYKGRFSNGPVWVENLANTLGLELHDFSIGGSTSDNRLVQGYTGRNSSIAVPSAMDQLSQYLGSGAIKGDTGDTLFVIATGANNMIFDANTAVAQTTGDIVSIMKRLGENGAKHFFLASYPDISRWPLHAYVTPTTNRQLHAFSAKLRTSLRALAGNDVVYADFYQLFNDIYANPDRYGFDGIETTKSCLRGAYDEAPRTLCDDPDKYIFWDIYHPTRKAHQVIAAFAEKAIHSKFST